MSNRNQKWIDMIHKILTEESARATMTIDDLFENGQLLTAIEALMAENSSQSGQDAEALIASLYGQLGDENAVEELDELLALFQFDKEQTNDSIIAVEPQSAPRYNFDFLPKRTAPKLSPSIPEQIRTQWQPHQAWARDQVGRLWINVAQLLQGGSGLQPAFATRSDAKGDTHDAQKPLVHFTAGKQELENLDVEVTALPAEDAAFCTLHITAWVPDQWPAMGDIEIVVHGTDVVRRAVTDAEGKVTMPQIPVADLDRIAIQVNPSSNLSS